MRLTDEPVEWTLLAIGREVRIRYREGADHMRVVATVIAVTDRNVMVRAWGTTQTVSLHRSVVLRVRPMGPAVLAARSAVGDAQRRRMMRTKAGTP